MRLQLWAGVGSEADRALLRDYQKRLPELGISSEVWEKACELADRCRRAGKTAPPHDIAIAACALYHGVEIEHDDAHFDLLTSI